MVMVDRALGFAGCPLRWALRFSLSFQRATLILTRRMYRRIPSVSAPAWIPAEEVFLNSFRGSSS